MLTQQQGHSDQSGLVFQGPILKSLTTTTNRINSTSTGTRTSIGTGIDHDTGGGEVQVRVDFAVEGGSADGIYFSATPFCDHKNPSALTPDQCCDQTHSNNPPFEVLFKNGSNVVVPSGLVSVVQQHEQSAGLAGTPTTIVPAHVLISLSGTDPSQVHGVRYAFQDYPSCVLINSAGLPAAPATVLVQ